MSAILKSWPLGMLCLATIITLANAQDNPGDSPEAGIAFDLANEETSRTSAETEATGSDASDGSGAMATETTFSSAELDELADMESYYAPYEMDAGNRDADGNFVAFSVIEPDEREVVLNTTLRPSRSIVQIRFKKTSGASSYGCTGAMIAPDFVLTAGHCVFSGGAWHNQFRIYPGRNGGVKPFGECAAEKLYSVNGWINPSSVSDSRLYDIGAIKLNCNIGEQTGWFAVRSIPDTPNDKRTMISGYPCDKTPGGRQWLSNDEIREMVDLKIFYQNDTYGCMSGSPVFLGEDQNTIYAVHTNGLHGGLPWSANNAATRLTEERVATILSWMQE